jgi:hypothetical protein
MTEEKIQFSRPLLILGNLALIAWIFLAFFNVFFYTPLYSWIYLVAVAIVIYLILRRLGCNSCYQCKECTSGFGRLAGAFFGRGFVKKASVGKRVGVVGFVYFLLLPLPVAFLSLSLLWSIQPLKFVVLALTLAMAAYSLSTWFNRSVKKA